MVMNRNWTEAKRFHCNSNYTTYKAAYHVPVVRRLFTDFSVEIITTLTQPYSGALIFRASKHRRPHVLQRWPSFSPASRVLYGRRDRRGSIRNSISDFWVEPQWWSPNPNLSAGFWPIKEVTWPTHMVFWRSTNAARLDRVAQNLAAAPRTCRIRTNYMPI